MSIEKTWISKGESGHNMIIFDDNILYRRKVKSENFEAIEYELRQGLIGDEFTGIPISYVKTVEYRKDDNFLKLSYGKESIDSFDIIDQKIRKEVFDYLKTNTTIKKSWVKQPNIISRIKSPLIALLVLVGLFIYLYVLIDNMNQGYEYEISTMGVGSFVLGLAYFGLTKNIIVFSILGLVALYRIKINLDNNSEIHYLEYML